MSLLPPVTRAAGRRARSTQRPGEQAELHGDREREERDGPRRARWRDSATMERLLSARSGGGRTPRPSAPWRARARRHILVPRPASRRAAVLSFGDRERRDDPLRPAYLIFGNDRPKVRRAVTRLGERVVRGGRQRPQLGGLRRRGDSAADVLEAASTPGFTLGTRLLLVLNAHKWKAEGAQGSGRLPARPMPDTCLAVEGETLRQGRTPCCKAVPSGGHRC